MKKNLKQFLTNQPISSVNLESISAHTNQSCSTIRSATQGVFQGPEHNSQVNNASTYLHEHERLLATQSSVAKTASDLKSQSTAACLLSKFINEIPQYDPEGALKSLLKEQVVIDPNFDLAQFSSRQLSQLQSICKEIGQQSEDVLLKQITWQISMDSLREKSSKPFVIKAEDETKVQIQVIKDHDRLLFYLEQLSQTVESELQPPSAPSNPSHPGYPPSDPPMENDVATGEASIEEILAKTQISRPSSKPSLLQNLMMHQGTGQRLKSFKNYSSSMNPSPYGKAQRIRSSISRHRQQASAAQINLSSLMPSLDREAAGAALAGLKRGGFSRSRSGHHKREKSMRGHPALLPKTAMKKNIPKKKKQAFLRAASVSETDVHLSREQKQLSRSQGLKIREPPSSFGDTLEKITPAEVENKPEFTQTHQMLPAQKSRRAGSQHEVQSKSEWQNLHPIRQQKIQQSMQKTKRQTMSMFSMKNMILNYNQIVEQKKQLTLKNNRITALSTRKMSTHTPSQKSTKNPKSCCSRPFGISSNRAASQPAAKEFSLAKRGSGCFIKNGKLVRRNTQITVASPNRELQRTRKGMRSSLRASRHSSAFGSTPSYQKSKKASQSRRQMARNLPLNQLNIDLKSYNSSFVNMKDFSSYKKGSGSRNKKGITKHRYNSCSYIPEERPYHGKKKDEQQESIETPKFDRDLPRDPHFVSAFEGQGVGLDNIEASRDFMASQSIPNVADAPSMGTNIPPIDFTSNKAGSRKRRLKRERSAQKQRGDLPPSGAKTEGLDPSGKLSAVIRLQIPASVNQPSDSFGGAQVQYESQCHPVDPSVQRIEANFHCDDGRTLKSERLLFKECSSSLAPYSRFLGSVSLDAPTKVGIELRFLKCGEPIAAKNEVLLGLLTYLNAASEGLDPSLLTTSHSCDELSCLQIFSLVDSVAAESDFGNNNRDLQMARPNSSSISSQASNLKFVQLLQTMQSPVPSTLLGAGAAKAQRKADLTQMITSAINWRNISASILTTGKDITERAPTSLALVDQVAFLINEAIVSRHLGPEYNYGDYRIFENLNTSTKKRPADYPAGALLGPAEKRTSFQGFENDPPLVINSSKILNDDGPKSRGYYQHQTENSSIKQNLHNNIGLPSSTNAVLDQVVVPQQLKIMLRPEPEFKNNHNFSALDILNQDDLVDLSQQRKMRHKIELVQEYENFRRHNAKSASMDFASPRQSKGALLSVSMDKSNTNEHQHIEDPYLDSSLEQQRQSDSNTLALSRIQSEIQNIGGANSSKNLTLIKDIASHQPMIKDGPCFMHAIRLEDLMKHENIETNLKIFDINEAQTLSCEKVTSHKKKINETPVVESEEALKEFPEKGAGPSGGFVYSRNIPHGGGIGENGQTTTDQQKSSQGGPKLLQFQNSSIGNFLNGQSNQGSNQQYYSPLKQETNESALTMDLKKENIVNCPNIHNLVRNFSSKEKYRKQNLIQLNRQVLQNQFISKPQQIYRSLELPNRFVQQGHQPMQKKEKPAHLGRRSNSFLGVYNQPTSKPDTGVQLPYPSRGLKGKRESLPTNLRSGSPLLGEKPNARLDSSGISNDRPPSSSIYQKMFNRRKGSSKSGNYPAHDQGAGPRGERKGKLIGKLSKKRDSLDAPLPTRGRGPVHNRQISLMPRQALRGRYSSSLPPAGESLKPSQSTTQRSERNKESADRKSDNDLSGSNQVPMPQSMEVTATAKMDLKKHFRPTSSTGRDLLGEQRNSELFKERIAMSILNSPNSYGSNSRMNRPKMASLQFQMAPRIQNIPPIFQGTGCPPSAEGTMVQMNDSIEFKNSQPLDLTLVGEPNSSSLSQISLMKSHPVFGLNSKSPNLFKADSDQWHASTKDYFQPHSKDEQFNTQTMKNSSLEGQPLPRSFQTQNGPQEFNIQSFRPKQQESVVLQQKLQRVRQDEPSNMVALPMFVKTGDRNQATVAEETSHQVSSPLNEGQVHSMNGLGITHEEIKKGRNANFNPPPPNSFKNSSLQSKNFQNILDEGSIGQGGDEATMFLAGKNSMKSSNFKMMRLDLESNTTGQNAEQQFAMNTQNLAQMQRNTLDFTSYKHNICQSFDQNNKVHPQAPSSNHLELSRFIDQSEVTTVDQKGLKVLDQIGGNVPAPSQSNIISPCHYDLPPSSIQTWEMNTKNNSQSLKFSNMASANTSEIIQASFSQKNQAMNPPPTAMPMKHPVGQAVLTSGIPLNPPTSHSNQPSINLLSLSENPYLKKQRQESRHEAGNTLPFQTGLTSGAQQSSQSHPHVVEPRFENTCPSRQDFRLANANRFVTDRDLVGSGLGGDHGRSNKENHRFVNNGLPPKQMSLLSSKGETKSLIKKKFGQGLFSKLKGDSPMNSESCTSQFTQNQTTHHF